MFTRVLRSHHDGALGSIRGPPGAGRAAGRARRRLRRRRLRRSGSSTHLSQGGFDDPDSESARELQPERDIFGNQNIDVVAIYTSDDLDGRSDPEFQADVEDVVAGLTPRAPPPAVMPYYDAPADAGLVSKDGHSVQVLISLAGESQDDYLSNYDELEPTLERRDGLETDLAGAFAVYNDVNEITSEDLARAESISMPIVLLLALLIFGSLVAALDAGPGRRCSRWSARSRVVRVISDVHRGLGLLGQRDLAARHRPGDRLRAVRDQPVPRGARAAARRRPGRRRRRRSAAR